MNTTRMVIGSITVTLAIIGLAWTVARIFDAAERAWDWLVRDRVTPLLEDDDELTDLPPGLELPPERTWEQMTSHQLPVVVPPPPGYWLNEPPDSETFLRGMWGEHYGQPGEPGDPAYAPQRERRAPWWEAEHRAAYESLGFDYPSGLMARVRELAP